MRKLLLLINALLLVVSSNANLLENGDFETWNNNETFPTVWGTSTLLTGASINKIQTNVFSGNNALQAQYTSTTSHSRFNTSYFNVTPGARYKLTYFTKGIVNLRWIVLTPNGIAPRAPVDGDPNLPASDYSISGTQLQNNNWTKRECYFDVPADVTELEYCLHFSYNATVAPYHFSIDKVSFSLVQPNDGSPWQSDLVKIDQSGKLSYFPDDFGYYVPDFSAAGYRGGGVALPYVPTVKTITALKGDNTSSIQAAIDEVGQLPLVNGIRGAVLLQAGLYNVSGSITIDYDGVVLRGVGQGSSSTTSTILHATGTQQRTFIYIGNKNSSNNWTSKIGSNLYVVDSYLPAGENKIKLTSTTSLSVGNQIILQQDDTQAWLDAIEGGVGNSGALPWTLADNLYIPYNRYITAIDYTNNIVTLDAPLYYGFRKSLSQSYVYKLNTSNIVKEVGIENLRVDCDFDPTVITTDDAGTYQSDESHPWDAISFISVENGWAKDVTVVHFGGSSFILSSTTRSTIKDCSAIDPISIITGERRYGFNTAGRCQLVLFDNCYARNGRHHFVSNGTSTASGNVYLRCRSDLAYAASEGHRKWSSGYLFDNYKEIAYNGTYDHTLALYNRGDYGTSHGWSMVTGVAWNCDLTTGNPTKGHLIIQQPPTGQNFAIGCKAAAIDNISTYYGPQGYIEGANNIGQLQPASLYDAQLTARINNSTKITDVFSKNTHPHTFRFIYTGEPIKVRMDDISSKSVLIIFSLAGQVMYQTTIENSQSRVKLGSIPKGLYIANIKPLL